MMKAPQPLQPWTGEWDASSPAPKCFQYDGWEKKIGGDEDCLYLNVYTPKLPPGGSLPVVVFIHGGAFMYGDGSRNHYSPSNLMDLDVVFVSLQYRLGALGFLSTGDEVVPGNNGLKDQAFALHWIKQHIAAFGGNPHAITLTGNSAGGASVHYHYLSPLSRGTFNRGIAFSGSAFAPWTVAAKPVQHARRLASLVGCPPSPSRALVDCLVTKPALDIAKAQSTMHDWDVHMFTRFTPTIEPEVENAFLSQHPFVASQNGESLKLPLIITVTAQEGLYPAGKYINKSNLLEDLEARWEQLASEIFEYNDTLPLHLRADVAAKIKQEYLDGSPVSKETFPKLVQALSDRLFVADSARLAEEHAKSGQPTYVYQYNYHQENTLTNIMTGDTKDYGVCHADDMLLIFGNGAPTRPDDVKINDLLLNIIHSFASTGVPKVPNGVEWLPVVPGSAKLDYLQISSPESVEMRSSSDFGHRSFWDSLGFTENGNFEKSNEI